MYTEFWWCWGFFKEKCDVFVRFLVESLVVTIAHRQHTKKFLNFPGKLKQFFSNFPQLKIKNKFIWFYSEIIFVTTVIYLTPLFPFIKLVVVLSSFQTFNFWSFINLIILLFLFQVCTKFVIKKLDSIYV